MCLNTHIHIIFNLSVIDPMPLSSFFFFNDTATTEIYTLSLHDALPILDRPRHPRAGAANRDDELAGDSRGDRKSTRLNSSHLVISYAVFCLKKKKAKRLTQLFFMWIA